jgi:hypothetical protein
MPDPFTTSPSERLATVVRCRSTGAWGTYTDLGFGRCRVTGDGFDAFVTPGVNGWVVAPLRGDFIGQDSDLETAACLALNP